jgi:hypothetical protein
MLEHRNTLSTCARKHVNVRCSWKMYVSSLRGSHHFDWRGLASEALDTTAVDRRKVGCVCGTVL